jgi:hypothetical protein
MLLEDLPLQVAKSSQVLRELLIVGKGRFRRVCHFHDDFGEALNECLLIL